jgi:hypothetical protein
MSKAAELAKWGEVSTNGQVSGRRNIVINGAMNVAQRGTSSTGLGATDGYYTVDRFGLNFSGTDSRLTMTQDSPTDLSGFTKALKLDCTTADTSIAAAEYIQLHYRIEGQDLQQLKKGTSDAEKITVSFYVKGNASATYTCEIEDVDNNRYNSQEFSVTTSWTKVTLTYNADTTGVLGNDNGSSMAINFWLHAGSNFTSGTHTDNVWHTTATQRVGDNQTSFADSTDRTFFITGVQLEVGSQATPFEHRSYGEELALCQRYYWNLVNGTDNEIGIGAYQTSSELNNIIQFPVLMRTGPTLDIVTGTNYYKINRSGASDGFNSFTIARATTRNALIYNGSEISGTAGQAGETQSGNASAFLSFTAEL